MSAEDMGLGLECGQSVYETCVGVTVEKTNSGFKKYMSTVVNVGNGSINVFLQFQSKQLSSNEIKGVNALRCAFLQGFENNWNFIASWWWYLYFFNLENLIDSLLDYSYPYLCTCMVDIDSFAGLFGGTLETA